MRIAYVSDSRYPSNDANAVHTMQMGAAFHEVVPDFRAFAFAEKRLDSDSIGELFSKFAVSPFPLTLVNRKALSSRIIGRRRRIWTSTCLFSPDAIYTRDISFFCRFSRVLFKPVFIEVHKAPEVIANVLGNRHGRICGIVTITQSLKDEISKLAPAADIPVFVAPDAASVPTYDYRTSRTFVPPESPHPRIGYTGSFLPGKGVEFIRRLARACPEAAFFVAGGSPEQIGEFRKSGDQPRNLHLLGHIEFAKLPGFRAEMDLCIVPNSEEIRTGDGSDIGAWTSPLKVFEYMASRKPIIASDLPVLREVLIHNHNAFLCESGNVDVWTKAIETLWNRPDLRGRLADNAYNDFQEKHTWRRRAEEVFSFMKRRLADRAGTMRTRN